VTNLDDESRFIVFQNERRKDDDQMAIIGNTVYQCHDGFRMYTQDQDGTYISYGIYFGPQATQHRLEGSTPKGLDKRDDSDKRIRLACLKEQP
jgi:hypothetical protein